MPKQTLPVEWLIAESEAEWQRLCAPPTPDLTPPIQRHLAAQRFLGSVALLLCLLVGAWWWRTHQIRVRQQAIAAQVLASPHQTPLAPTTDWLRQPGQEGSRKQQAGQNVASPGYSFAAEQPLTVQGDQAWGRVVMYTEHGEPVYRQTRFYQHTTTGWQQTEPDAALWGAPRTLETPAFVYHFRQQDASIVTAVAMQIEALYTTLRRNVGLPGAPADEKVIIEVSVTQLPGYAPPLVRCTEAYPCAFASGLLGTGCVD